MRLRLLSLGSFALVVGLGAGACSGGRDPLTIYSGRDEALVAPVLEDFAEQTGIDVDVKYEDSSNLALLLEQEGEDTPADVFLSQSPGPMAFLAGSDLLAALDEATLDRVDERWRGSDGRWVGVTARQRVLVYNADMVERAELPESVFDLVDRAYEGEVALAPANASFQDFVTAMRLVEGDDATQEWLDGMEANGSPTYADNSSIVAAVGRGEIPMGLVNHYYNLRALDEDPSLPSRNYVFPADDLGSLLIDSTVGVLAATDHRDDADRLVDFLLAEEAQTFFSRETFEYPLAEEVDGTGAVPRLDDVVGMRLDLGELGDLETTAQMIRDSGLL